MKKRSLPLFLVTVMLFSLLTVACGAKTPTAQELVDNAFSTMPTDKTNLKMEMYTEMSTESDLLGQTVSMNTVMDIDLDIKSTTDVGYTSGVIKLEMFGMEIEQATEVYVDMKEGINYTLTDGTWYKEAMSEEELSHPSEEEVQSIRAESFTDLTLVEDENEENTEWIVTGVLDYSKIVELFGDNLTESMGTAIDTDIFSDFKMQVEMTFDKETHELKTIKCVSDEENLNKLALDGVSYDALEIFITLNDTTDLVVEIPEEVKTTAVEYTLDSDSALDTELDLGL